MFIYPNFFTVLSIFLNSLTIPFRCSNNEPIGYNLWAQIKYRFSSYYKIINMGFLSHARGGFNNLIGVWLYKYLQKIIKVFMCFWVKNVRMDIPNMRLYMFYVFSRIECQNSILDVWQKTDTNIQAETSSDHIWCIIYLFEWFALIDWLHFQTSLALNLINALCSHEAKHQ